MGLVGGFDGVLLDLGVSSPQLDDAARGFSFAQDGPLDMRMNNRTGMTAADWLARAPEREIARVIRDYGEERFAKRIARAIVAARDVEPPIANAAATRGDRRAAPCRRASRASIRRRARFRRSAFT